jgi:hypothetical protein
MSKSNLVHFRRFDTYEEYLEWYQITFVGRRHLLSRAKWQLRQPPVAAVVKLLVMSARRWETTIAAARFACPEPACESKEVAAWTDDGTYVLVEQADWWECRYCGLSGAVLHPTLPGVTRNGVPIAGFSPLPAA